MAQVLGVVERITPALARVAQRLLGADDVLVHHVELGQAMLVCPEHEHPSLVPVAQVLLFLRLPEHHKDGAWATGGAVVPVAKLLDLADCERLLTAAVEDLIFTRQEAGMPDLAALGDDQPDP